VGAQTAANNIQPSHVTSWRCQFDAAALGCELTTSCNRTYVPRTSKVPIPLPA
jgi:hypothetical protein